MRYRFVDEIVSLTLDGAPRIEVVKRFDASDDIFSGPQGPERVPESMLLELMATTGGHLLFRHLGERRLPLLLKVAECRFEGWVPAGERGRGHQARRIARTARPRLGRHAAAAHAPTPGTPRSIPGTLTHTNMIRACATRTFAR